MSADAESTAGDSSAEGRANVRRPAKNPLANVFPLRQQRSQPRETEFNSHLAVDWDVWSEDLGHSLMPILEKLAASMPRFRSAMICTADGFNLCALGADPEAVDRLAALSSSMQSMAEAIIQGLDHRGQRLETINLSHGSGHVVLVAVRGLSVGPLLVWVAAEETLGLVLVRAKVAAAEVGVMAR
jgi:predicted regulator of Ras-like GTPase activity (Roadblock/LC7/MglB family)